MRQNPNIIVTGTPGVGKTTHCEELATATGLTHLDINKVVREQDCTDGYDDVLKSSILDEDKLLDAIEDDLAAGGQIIDYHASEFFPQSKIDLVLVLRAKTETLFDRLKARGYAQNKIDEDMDAEIMEVALQEAREAYDEEIVIELMSDDVDEIEGNVERVKKWVEAWKEKQIDDDAEDDS